MQRIGLLIDERQRHQRGAGIAQGDQVRSQVWRAGVVMIRRAIRPRGRANIITMKKTNAKT